MLSMFWTKGLKSLTGVCVFCDFFCLVSCVQDSLHVFAG